MLKATYETRYTVASGVPCVAVRQPATEWWYVITLENVLLAATTGCGYRRPGTLACGYGGHVMKDGKPCPGWVVGYFEPADLQRIYDEAPPCE